MRNKRIEVFQKCVLAFEITFWGLNMVDERKETNENLFSEDKIKEIVEAHARYRHYGQAITSMIILFSSAIIAWAIQEYRNLISISYPLIFYLILCPLFFSIISGILSQVLIYWGYLLEAGDMGKALSEKQFSGNCWANIVTQGTNKSKNYLFRMADIGTFLSAGTFIFAIVSLGIYLIP